MLHMECDGSSRRLCHVNASYDVRLAGTNNLELSQASDAKTDVRTTPDVTTTSKNISAGWDDDPLAFVGAIHIPVGCLVGSIFRLAKNAKTHQ